MSVENELIRFVKKVLKVTFTISVAEIIKFVVKITLFGFIAVNLVKCGYSIYNKFPRGVYGPSGFSYGRDLIEDLKKTEKDIRYVSFNESSFRFMLDDDSDYADIKRCADKIKLLVSSEPYRTFNNSYFFIGAYDRPYPNTTGMFPAALQTGRDGGIFSKLMWGEDLDIVNDLSGITEIEFHAMGEYEIPDRFFENLDVSGITYITCDSDFVSQLPAERLVNLKTIEINFDYGATEEEIARVKAEAKELFPDCEIVI